MKFVSAKSLPLFGILFLSAWAPTASALVYETAQEFLADGDFDGDGRTDVVIVDKSSGKCRFGYQLSDGQFTWVLQRPSGVRGVSGVSVGKLLKPNCDALAITSADANQLAVLDASSPTAATPPQNIPLSVMGPNTALAIDIGGTGNTPLADLVVGSVYNTPDANLLTLIRSADGQFTAITNLPMAQPASHANRVVLQAGKPEVGATLVGEAGDTLAIGDFRDGKPRMLGTLTGLPAGGNYAVGQFRDAALPDFVFFKPGENNLLVKPVESASDTEVKFTTGGTVALDKPVLNVFTLPEAKANKLLVLFSEGQSAGIYKLDAPDKASLNEAPERVGDRPQGIP
jgi:hypothetical protein